MKNTKALNSLTAFLALVLFSCSEGKLNVKDYVAYTENESNGLRKVKTISPYTISVQYKPLDYVVALEQRKSAINKEIMEARKKKLDGMEYFTLRILP